MDANELGTVYIAPYYIEGEPRDDTDQQSWSSWQIGSPEGTDRPEFDDLSEGVAWWQARGARRIFVTFDASQRYHWAGSGPPPIDPETELPFPRFSHADPRGRHQGLIATIRVDDERMDQWRSARTFEHQRRDGVRLASRRLAAGLSVEAVAERMGIEPQWILDLENGELEPFPNLEAWVELVWATQDPWPDERQSLVSMPTKGRWGSTIDNSILVWAEELVREACT
jgi:hypothetical protein